MLRMPVFENSDLFLCFGYHVFQAAIKEGKRTARVAKKEMKILYKDESQRARHSAALTGPGTVHLS